MFAEFGTGEVFWSFLWFTLFFIWIWLLIAVFADIFRSHDMGGVAKAIWIVAVIVAPYLGVFVYLIARGKKMGEHAVEDAQKREEMFRSSVQDIVLTTPPAGPSAADELQKLAEHKAQGVIDDAEFAKLKAQYTAA
jgi:hypothetical protein